MDTKNIKVRCGDAEYTVRRQVAAERGYIEGAQVPYDELLEMHLESSALSAAQYELSIANIKAGGQGHT